MEENNKPIEPNEPVVPQEPTMPQQPAQEQPAQQQPMQPEQQSAQPQISFSEQVAQPQSVNSSIAPNQTTGLPAMPEQKPKNSKKKLLLPLIVMGAFLLAGGAAAYQMVFNKSPQQLFESALTNTSKGLDTFLAIDQSKKGLKIDGSFDVNSPLAVDGTLSGQWYEMNGSLTSSVGAVGARVTNEIRTLSVENSDVPDLYIKFSGLEGVDGLLRTFAGPDASEVAGVVQSLNDQWYVVDHTLIEQALASSGSSSDVPELSEEDIKQISDAVAGVMRERFFGTEEDKAVFKINEEIGKEDFEGTGTYKLNVRVDKDNFIAFLESFESVVKDTKLKDVFALSAPGQNIDEVLNFDNISESLKDVDFSEAKADVWVEGNGRFIRNVRIYPVSDKKDTNYLDLLLPYEGGDVFPLVMRATIDDSDAKGVASFGADINQKNGDSRLWFDLDITSDGTTVDASAELKIESIDEQVAIEKPDGAKSALELINQLTGGMQSSVPVFPGAGLGTIGLDDSRFDDIEVPFEVFGR